MTSLLQLPLILKPPVLVRVSDLRQWTYCPRVIWWTQVCPVGRYVSFKMKKGQEKELRLQRLQKRRTLKSFGMKLGEVQTNVVLISERLGLTGKLDMMVVQGIQRLPAEIKFTQGHARLNHRLQLAGYAMLIEEVFGTSVPVGFVIRLPDDEVDTIEIDDSLRKLATQTIEAIRSTISRECIPAAVPVLGRCVDCEFRNFCHDIEVVSGLHLENSQT
ncbi:MAG TPA: CRISPR-associated protein Cas4 [Pirellula sp.]|nr:CRISPR-associated protein Cas4 [Pirellula sp.]